MEKDKRETATLIITMPLGYFLKWDYECKRDYNDVRYIKLMSDSQKARLFDKLLEGSIQTNIEELKQLMKGE